MVPLITLNGDDIVEGFLLRPTTEEPGSSPTPEEEAVLLDEEDEQLAVPGPIPKHTEIPRFAEHAEWTTTPITPALSCLESKPHICPSQKVKKLEGIDVDPNNPSQWVQAYMERDNRIPEWWKEFYHLVCSADGCYNNAKVKLLASQQAVAFHLPAAQKEAHGYWTAHPAWQY